MANEQIQTAPSKTTVYFLYNGLVQFYPELAFGDSGKKQGYKNFWGGFERSDFLQFLFNITREDIDFKAADKVKAWKLAYDSGKYPDATLPQNINELVEDLEKLEKDKKTFETQKTAKKLLLESQKQREVEQPIKETSRTDEAIPEVKPEELPIKDQVSLIISPSATADIGQSLTKAIFMPLKVLINLGGYGVYKRNPNLKGSTTAFWAISNGVTSGELMKALGNAEKQGILINPLKVQALVKLMQEQETGHPRISHLAQIAYNPQVSFGQLKLTQSELSSLFLKGPQGQEEYVITSSPKDNSYYLPEEYFSLGPITGLANTVIGNLSSRVLNRAIEKGISITLKTAGLTAKKAATAAAKTAATSVVEGGVAVGSAATGPGIVIALVILAKKVIKFLSKELKNLVSKLSIFITGEKDKDMRRLAFASLFFAGLGLFGFGTGSVIKITGIAASGIGGTGLLGEGVMNAKGVATKASTLTQSLVYGVTAVVAPAIGLPFIIGIASAPLAIALILFIINSGAYLVPPQPVAFGGGLPIECTLDKVPISFPNNSSSNIAKRGWEIVSDLYQGFWCYWNRSPGDFPDDVTSYPPSYPNLFDENLFRSKPFPTVEEMSVCGECMFWCTWLIQKSYLENGYNDLLYTLWAPAMKDDFDRRGKFISANNTTPDNVPPGSVVFFHVVGGHNSANHVGIIYSVSQDEVTYIQSNAPTKEGSITFNESGQGLQNLPGIDIVGIGLP